MTAREIRPGVPSDDTAKLAGTPIREVLSDAQLQGLRAAEASIKHLVPDLGEFWLHDPSLEETSEGLVVSIRGVHKFLNVVIEVSVTPCGVTHWRVEHFEAEHMDVEYAEANGWEVPAESESALLAQLRRLGS